MYTFAGWGAYLGLWYAQLLPRMSKYRPNSEVEKAIKGFLAILGPIMYVIRVLFMHTRPNRFSRILFTRRIVQLWFTRKGNVEGRWQRLNLVLAALTHCTHQRRVWQC
jgi:endoplasmic reticulum junction formation protein lunapark